MKTILTVLGLSVLFSEDKTPFVIIYHISYEGDVIISGVTTVASSCVSCHYGTPADQCSDPYKPPIPESEVCSGVRTDLCAKYGDYEVYCTDGRFNYSCKKRGYCEETGQHGGRGSKLTSSLVLTVAAVFSVMRTRH